MCITELILIKILNKIMINKLKYLFIKLQSKSILSENDSLPGKKKSNLFNKTSVRIRSSPTLEEYTKNSRPIKNDYFVRTHTSDQKKTSSKKNNFILKQYMHSKNEILNFLAKALEAKRRLELELNNMLFKTKIFYLDSNLTFFKLTINIFFIFLSSIHFF